MWSQQAKISFWRIASRRRLTHRIPLLDSWRFSRLLIIWTQSVLRDSFYLSDASANNTYGATDVAGTWTSLLVLSRPVSELADTVRQRFSNLVIETLNTSCVLVICMQLGSVVGILGLLFCCCRDCAVELCFSTGFEGRVSYVLEKFWPKKQVQAFVWIFYGRA